MIIETQNLTRKFGSRDAVDGLNLTVPEGSAVALIGANGAGKTTTIRMLMNFIQPSVGEARVLGADSRALRPSQYAQIGYVSENQKLPGGLTVSQYFDYLRALYPTWDTALEAEIRGDLDLPADRKIGKLSHGMRMKCAMAAALPYRPKLLVLDEPLSGLDPLVRDQLMESLLRQAGETTVLISSHELSEIEGAVTDIAFMEEGRLLFQEPLETLRSRFREVSVTLPKEDKPKRPPARWINGEMAGRTYRVVDSAFIDEAELARELGRHIGPFEGLETRPMSLRSISKALIRTTSKGGSK